MVLPRKKPGTEYMRKVEMFGIENIKKLLTIKRRERNLLGHITRKE